MSVYLDSPPSHELGRYRLDELVRAAQGDQRRMVQARRFAGNAAPLVLQAACGSRTAQVGSEGSDVTCGEGPSELS